MTTRPDCYSLSSDLVGHDDGKLSLTLPVEHTVEHDYAVAMGPGWTDHIIVARVYNPAVGPRSWLVTYRMAVTTESNGFKRRSYGAFNYARSMPEARQMSDDLIASSRRSAEFLANERVAAHTQTTIELVTGGKCVQLTPEQVAVAKAIHAAE